MAVEVCLAAAWLAASTGCADSTLVAGPSERTEASVTPSTARSGPSGVHGVFEVTTTAVDGSAEVDPDGRVARLMAGLPYPADVVDCVAGRAATDPALAGAVRAARPDDEGSLKLVLAAAAQCEVEVRAAPAFAAGLQERAHGALTRRQVACLVEGYGALSPGQVALATAAVANPGVAGAAAARQPVIDVMDECGVEIDG